MNIPDEIVIKYIHDYLTSHAILRDMRNVYGTMVDAKKTGKGLDDALSQMHGIYNKIKILDGHLKLQRQEYLTKGK